MTTESFSEQDPSCIIVGAGIAGLFAGKELHRQGIRVRLVEKAGGVGGRMATRRFEGGVFDHGTQYFTPASAWFQTRIDEWLEDGIAREWFRVSQYEMDQRFLSSARYCGVAFMTAIPKRLAEGMDILTGKTISRLNNDGVLWHAQTVDGENFTAHACILTPPLPQALDILERSSGITGEVPAHLRTITYDPCITVLANCEIAPKLPGNGVLEFAEGPLRRIMDNHRKGISPDAHAVTIHGSAEFSRTHFDTHPEESGALLLEHARKYLSVSILSRQTHRWRFSNVIQPAQQHFHVVHDTPPLVLAGDAFGSNGVEGAARSGLKAAQHIRDYFARNRRG